VICGVATVAGDTWLSTVPISVVVGRLGWPRE
jgi:hypothetical protein